ARDARPGARPARSRGTDEHAGGGPCLRRGAGDGALPHAVGASPARRTVHRPDGGPARRPVGGRVAPTPPPLGYSSSVDILNGQLLEWRRHGARSGDQDVTRERTEERDGGVQGGVEGRIEG